MEVLRHKRHSGNHKFAFEDIQQHKRVSVNTDKRGAEKEREQKETQDCPAAVISAFRLPRINPFAFSVFGDACQFTPKYFVVFDGTIYDCHGVGLNLSVRLLRYRSANDVALGVDGFGFGRIGAVHRENITCYLN